MNNNTIQSPKTVVRTLGIIHLALLAGQALFAFVMFTLSEQTSIKLDKNDIFIFIVLYLTVVIQNIA
jgi:hypothetical protein